MLRMGEGCQQAASSRDEHVTYVHLYVRPNCNNSRFKVHFGAVIPPSA